MQPQASPNPHEKEKDVRQTGDMRHRGGMIQTGDMRLTV